MLWPRLRWFGTLFLVAVLSACVTGVTAWRLIGFRQEPSVNVQAEVPAARRPSAPRAASVGRTTVLVLGVDERLDDVGRSDTIMVASMDPERGEVSLLSIQRDTWTEIPGYGWDKINHAYAFGKHQLALATVQQFLDIPIDHWTIINFAGFKQVVDALGGIEVEITEPMDYDDPYDDGGGLHIHFTPGRYLLSGDRALEYARYRSGPDGDLGRMRRQQEVVKLVLQKAMNPANALRVPQLVASLSNAIRTDLSLAEMIQLAAAGRDLMARGPLQTAVIKGEGANVGEVFYGVVDLVEARRTAYRLLLGQEAPAAFLERARQAQSTLLAALREAQDAHAAHQEEKAKDGTQVALAPAAVARDLSGSSGAGAAASPGAAPAQGAAGGAVAAPPRPKVVTVAVFDFSGRDLIGATVTRLRQQRFSVLRFARSSRTLDRTVIVDRSGDTQVAERLRQLFPWASLQEGAPVGDVQVEIRLGRDARPPSR